MITEGLELIPDGRGRKNLMVIYLWDVIGRKVSFQETGGNCRLRSKSNNSLSHHKEGFCDCRGRDLVAFLRPYFGEYLLAIGDCRCGAIADFTEQIRKLICVHWLDELQEIVGFVLFGFVLFA